MGRNTTTPSPSSLDRYSIGEIVDLAGVGSYYDAGTSKWLKSGTFVDGSNLSTNTKTVLAAAATSAGNANVALATTNDVAIVAQYPCVREQWQVARIPSISTTVIPRSVANPSVNVMVINSSGVTNVTIASPVHINNGYSAPFSLCSNESKFFVYYYTNTSTMACKSSTDGLTWTTETLTNLPTISSVDSNSTFWDFNYYNYAYPQAGWLYTSVGAGSYGVSGVFWCGARFLMLTKTTSAYIAASLSSDGVAFSANSASSVLGSATLPFTKDINFYRNGNNCFLAIGTTLVKSSDGGITWGAVSGTIGGIDANAQYNIPNTTDPAKRIINQGDGYSSAYYTSDSGATWSSNRALPQSSRWGIAYKGSTVVSSYTGGCYRSVDDGVTWTPITFPAGTNTSSGQILADAYRFYFVGHGQNQILTSTDAITWTISTLPGTINASGNDSIQSVNSSIAYITVGGLHQGVYTLDGGVTWAFARTSSGNYGVNTYGYSSTATIDGPNGGYLVQHTNSNSDASYNFFLSVAALTAGGAFYRTGSSEISSARTNATAYVRVG